MTTTRGLVPHSLRAGIVPVLFLLLAAWVTHEALQMPLGTILAPGAGFFPLGLGLLLAVLALLLWVIEGRGTSTSEDAASSQWRQVVCLTACVIAAAWLFEPVGFLVTTAVFLTVTIAMLGHVAWWRAAAMAIVGSATAWIVFVRILKIALPSGILPL